MAYLHIFSSQLPDGTYPLSMSRYGFMMNDTDRMKKWIRKMSKIQNDKYSSELHYHGIFMKKHHEKIPISDHIHSLSCMEFVRMDNDIKKIWDNAKLSNDFGI